jgi:ATPase subunit of ABC transporter with duplicated ATPase domains
MELHARQLRQSQVGIVQAAVDESHRVQLRLTEFDGRRAAVSEGHAFEASLREVAAGKIAAHQLDIDEPAILERRARVSSADHALADEFTVLVELERVQFAGIRLRHADILADDVVTRHPQLFVHLLALASPLSAGAAVSSTLSSLVARDITKSFGPRVILDRVSITVVPRSRLGVVAPNGTGKSTLLKILAGLERADAGTVTRTPPTATVGYLPQESDRNEGETLRAYLGRRTGVTAAERALHDTSHALSADVDGADAAYADALDRYLALGATDFEARVGQVCADVGIAPRLLDLDMHALSGGQGARARLAAILLARFDVFLLDEPTNDLDFAGLTRLESFLCDDLDGGALIVSHDRAFLDRVVTEVIELDEHTHAATEYSGGWRSYLDERATVRRHAEEAYETYLAQRTELRGRARRQREWSVQGAARVKKSDEPDKNIREFRRNSSEHVAAKAKTTDKALERLEAQAVDRPWQGWELRMQIARAPRSGAIVGRLTNAVVHRGDFTLGPINLQIDYGERVALLGANGSGKTTLLDALLGRLRLDTGTQWLGPSVIVGHIEQARHAFGTAMPLLTRFEHESGLLQEEARSLLAKFGLGADHVGRAADTLSPGERTRASLALLSARGVNCLVLDEPTNHLDLPAIEQLEQAVDTFDGTLLLVTHDRALLDAVRLTRRVDIADGRITADQAVA